MYKKLSTKQKFLYGLGDVFGGGGFTILSFLYVVFLTDEVGLEMKLVSPIIFLATIWDAISDPIMGYITDRTKSKYGRRRPYFLYGPVFILIFFMALWSPFDFESQIAKFIYVLAAYLLYNTAYTATMVPYFAYGAEVTDDYNERTKLGTFRLCLSIVSSLIVVSTPLVVVGIFQDVRMGYFAMSILYGLMFAGSVFAVFFVGKEKPLDKMPQKRKIHPIRFFSESLKIKSFRKLIYIFIIGSLAIDTITLIMIYYVKDYIGIDKSYSQLFLGTAMITQLLFVPIWSKVAIKVSKAKAYFYGSVITTVMLAVLFFIPQGVNMYIYLIIVFGVCIGLSAIVFLPHTMFPDVTDVAELAYGKRMEGQLSGIQTFCRKCSKAIGTTTITAILAAVGYQSTEGVEIQQAEQVVQGIKMIMTIVPIVTVFIAGQIARVYPINRKIHNEVRAHLKAIKGEPDGNKLTNVEVNELKQKLI